MGSMNNANISLGNQQFGQGSLLSQPQNLQNSKNQFSGQTTVNTLAMSKQSPTKPVGIFESQKLIHQSNAQYQNLLNSGTNQQQKDNFFVNDSFGYPAHITGIGKGSGLLASDHNMDKKVEDSIFQKKLSEHNLMNSNTNSNRSLNSNHQNSKLQRTFGSPSQGFLTLEDFKESQSEIQNSGPGSPLFLNKGPSRSGSVENSPRLNIGKSEEFSEKDNQYFDDRTAKKFFSTFILEEHELMTGKFLKLKIF